MLYSLKNNLHHSHIHMAYKFEILALECLINVAGSTDRRNTRIKTFSRCLKAQRLSWTLV